MLFPDVPVSIDIGSFSVKVAQVVGGRSGVRVLRFAEQRLPEGFHWEPGANLTPLVTAVRQALQRAGIRSRRAVLALPRRHVVARISALPPADRAQLQRVVEVDLADHVPFPMDQVIVDFQTLGPCPEQPGLMDVLVVAVQRDLVRQYLELVRALGMTPAALTVDAFALHDLASLRKDAAVGVHLTLEVGRRSTTISVSEGKRFRLSRSLPFGTQQLGAALREDFGLSPEEAEYRRLTEGVQGMQSKPRPVRTAAWLDNLKGELRRTALSFGPEAVTGVFLVGAGALTPGLSEALGQEFGATPVLLSPASLFPTAQLQGAETGAGDRCLLALGLALRAAGRSSFTISLVPREVAAARRQTLFQRAAVGAVIVLAGLLTLSYTGTKKEVAGLRAAHVKAAAQLREAEQKSGFVQQVQDQLAKLTSDLTELQPAQVRRYVALELLKTISEGADPEIILTSFQMRPGQPLQLRGTAPNAAAAADLQAALLRSNLVARASLDRVDLLGNGALAVPRPIPPLGRSPMGRGRPPMAAGQEGSGGRVNFMMSVQLRTTKSPKTHRQAARGGGQ